MQKKSEYEKNKNDVKNIGLSILERYFANLIILLWKHINMCLGMNK